MKSYVEISEILKGLGIKKNFKAYCEPETGAIIIRTRKPAQMIDGDFYGCEIFLTGGYFKVWTMQKNKAKAYSVKHGLKVRLLNGQEAELTAPASKADEILPEFGAIVKRVMDPVAKASLISRLERFRASRNAIQTT